MPEILIAIGALLLVLIVVVIIRTLRFKPREEKRDDIKDVSVNSDKAVSDLAEMIKCRTVSDVNCELEDEREFDKFKKLLPKLFPRIFEKCSYEEIGNRALLFKWEGACHDAPTVLMSHYDVVSVEEDKWEKPPFSGIVEDGVLWGRGTLDTKGTLNGILQAAEALIAEGFVPKNDIYFAFGGDEEINGHGASDIVDVFASRGITPGLVLDEGGAVIQNVFPGVSAPTALIGIAEKGMLNVEYLVTGGGGHSSAPKPHDPISRLSKAALEASKTPFRFRITPATAGMFDTLGRHSTFLYRMIFANLWLFSPVLNLLTKLTGGELNAIARTTIVMTQMDGSKGVNVIPAVARMKSNSRVLPGESTDEAIALIRKTIKDKTVEVKKIAAREPSVVSLTDCEAYERVKSVTLNTWRDALVTPYLMVACSDSVHWGRISDKVYRFSAMALSSEERRTIHGNNERIKVENVAKIVEFYTRLIQKS